MKANTEDGSLKRYYRNISLPEVGESGQKKILNGRVLVIGAGGLGSPALLYLAANGVGTLGIADHDVVELSNLQRQILHGIKDIGKPKTDSAKDKLTSINPDTKFISYKLIVDRSNIESIIRDYDFVIDATDNFSSKFLINDACVNNGIPFSHAGIYRFEGQTMTVIPHRSACYRCIFDSKPSDDIIPDSSQIGPLGPVPGIIGCIQATEALKFLIGTDGLLTNRLLTMDAKTMNFRTLEVSPNPECPVCGRSNI